MNYLKLLLALMFASVLVSCASWEGGTYKPMQEDFDKIRLDHLLQIDLAVKEYKKQKGYYPYEDQGLNTPVMIIIQTPEQEKTHGGNVPIHMSLELRMENGLLPEPNMPAIMHSTEEFETELSSVFGEGTILPKDPQKVPVNKPSVYIYTIYKGVYEVTGFLHHKLGIARPMAQFANKITISNKTLPQQFIWTADQVMSDEEVKVFLVKPFNKGGYTMKLAI